LPASEITKLGYQVTARAKLVTLGADYTVIQRAANNTRDCIMSIGGRLSRGSCHRHHEHYSWCLWIMPEIVIWT